MTLPKSEGAFESRYSLMDINDDDLWIPDLVILPGDLFTANTVEKSGGYHHGELIEYVSDEDGEMVARVLRRIEPATSSILP